MCNHSAQPGLWPYHPLLVKFHSSGVQWSSEDCGDVVMLLIDHVCGNTLLASRSCSAWVGVVPSPVGEIPVVHDRLGGCT